MKSDEPGHCSICGAYDHVTARHASVMGRRAEVPEERLKLSYALYSVHEALSASLSALDSVIGDITLETPSELEQTGGRKKRKKMNLSPEERERRREQGRKIGLSRWAKPAAFLPQT